MSASVFTRFSKESEEINGLKLAFEELCLAKQGGFATLTINQCNAAYGKYGKKGKTFSQADVDAITNDKPGDKLFCFGALFEAGFNLLESYLDNPESAPPNRCMEIILSKLLEFLLDKGQHDVLKSVIDEDIYKCELTARYAEHLFSKLGVSSSYTIDKYYKHRLRVCTCGCKKIVETCYGDTSIGNTQIWHGDVDLILDGCYVPVGVMEIEPESPGGKLSIEVKSNDSLESYQVESQLIAQTIVFSFLQKKKHPEYNNFLIPSIGISNSSVIFYKYDCENDVLLKSALFPLLATNGKLNRVVILAIWFVLNYRYLCSGFTEDHIKNCVKKSKFFELADGLLPVYQADISDGGNIRIPKTKARLLEPWRLHDSDFVLPPPKRLKTILPS